MGKSTISTGPWLQIFFVCLPGRVAFGQLPRAKQQYGGIKGPSMNFPYEQMAMARGVVPFSDTPKYHVKLGLYILRKPAGKLASCYLRTK